eukprot:scaffold10519_cov43-Attheya_sp.AAC.1
MTRMDSGRNFMRGSRERRRSAGQWELSLSFLGHVFELRKKWHAREYALQDTQHVMRCNSALLRQQQGHEYLWARDLVDAAASQYNMTGER